MEVLKNTTEIKIKNATYKIDKLNLLDWADLQDWAKKRIIDRLPIKTFDAGTLSEIAKIKIPEANIMDEIASISGIKQSLYLVFKRCNPSIENINKILSEIAIEDLASISTALTGDTGKKKQDAPVNSQ